jgi:hypothetical protein
MPFKKSDQLQLPFSAIPVEFTCEHKVAGDPWPMVKMTRQERTKGKIEDKF